MLRARAREETDLRSTMKELIKIIVQKTGISEENAQQAVQVTLGFLKAKLPTPLAAQLDSFLITRTPVVSPVAVGARAEVKSEKYRTRSHTAWVGSGKGSE